MARLKREDLKTLLKECLREILIEERFIEPLKENFNANNSTLNEGKTPAPFASHLAAKNIHTTNNQHANQNASHYSPQTMNTKNTKLVESVNAVASAFGENSSLFADLLADTAMTTLQAQRNGGMPGDRLSDGMVLESYVAEEHKHDVDKLQALAPDGDMKKWAKFAFAKKE